MGSVVHSKKSVVEVINNTHDLNYIGNNSNHFCVADRYLESSDSQNSTGTGHRQTKKNKGLSSVLPYGFQPYSKYERQCDRVTVDL